MLLASTAFAQQETFQLDPAKSTVDWTLSDVLHTVRGTFQLKSGTLSFDRANGTASGELVVDASSGQSGNNSRDKKMKKEILETEKFPTIVFAPQRVVGAVSDNGGSQVQLQGTMTLHGQGHPMTVVVPLQVSGGSTTAEVNFAVPYVEWGLKDPSTFILRVGKSVDIHVHAVGSLSQSPPQRAAP